MNKLEGSTDFLIQQQLMKWRTELHAASQILKGEHLSDFKQIIVELANTLNLDITDTGTFVKVDGEA